MLLQPTTDFRPRLHEMRMLATDRTVEHEETCQEGEACVCHPSIHGLHAHAENGINKLSHELAWRFANTKYAPTHLIDIDAIARKQTGNVVANSMSIECATHAATNNHVKHVEDTESLEEVVEVHTVM